MTPAELTAFKARHPILDVLERVGAEPPARWQSNGDVTIRCPSPGHDDHTPSCVVHAATDRFRCFGCGAHGDVVDLVQLVIGVRGFAEAVGWLERGMSVSHSPSLPRMTHVIVSDGGERPNLDRTPRERILDVNAAAWDVLTDQTRRAVALRYVRARDVDIDGAEILAGRPLVGYPPAGRSGLVTTLLRGGFSGEEIIDAGWGVCRDGALIDRLNRRAVFAVRDTSDLVIGFTARDVTGTARSKYLNTTATAAFSKANALYSPLTVGPGHRLVICEGPLDAIALASAESGSRDTLISLAALGTQLTARHVDIVRQLAPRTVGVMTDGDAAGEAAALRWMRALQDVGLTTNHIRVGAGMDPASELATRARPAQSPFITPSI